LEDLEKAFRGLDARERGLMIAARIGLIRPPARLSNRFKIYEQTINEFYQMLSEKGLLPVDDILEAERILLKQTWWGDFVEDWKEKWSIRDENDIGTFGYRYKKLQSYVYEFGYYYQTPADYKNTGPLELPTREGRIGPRRVVSWRVDVKSNSVSPVILPISERLEKGLVLASRHENEEAIVEFNEYIKTKPSDFTAYIVRGDSYEDTQQFEKAIDDYSKSIRLEPKLADTYDRRATAYTNLEDFQRAIKDYNKAIEIYPEKADYYCNKSVVYDKLSDIDGVIDCCTKAIELDENHATAYYMRAMSHTEKGEYDKALQDYNVAIRLKPEFIADVYFNRGILYQRKGEYKKALEDFKWIKKNVSNREDIEVVEQKIRELSKGGAMGLFGRKKTDYRKVALDMYLDNIYKAAGSQFEYSQWYSWGVGANAIFEGFKKIPGCEMIPDSLDKAKLLLEVGIQAMISLWYHSWESQESHSDEEKEMAREISLRNVQTFLGLSSEDAIKLYLGFDRELQECLSGKYRDPDKLKLHGTYVAVFCERCWECVTGEQIVDWSKLQFPTESYEEFVNACHKGKQHDIYEPLKTLIIWGVILTSGKPMFDTFTRMHKKRNK